MAGPCMAVVSELQGYESLPLVVWLIPIVPKADVGISEAFQAKEELEIVTIQVVSCPVHRPCA